MMSFHLKTFWTLFQIITEHYKALVASPQTDHYFAWCSVLFVPTIVICHWEATRRRAKKNQDKIYGAAGRRSVLTMLLRKSDKNIKLWLNICILSWLEIHILSLSLHALSTALPERAGTGSPFQHPWTMKGFLQCWIKTKASIKIDLRCLRCQPVLFHNKWYFSWVSMDMIGNLKFAKERRVRDITSSITVAATWRCR